MFSTCGSVETTCPEPCGHPPARDRRLPRAVTCGRGKSFLPLILANLESCAVFARMIHYEALSEEEAVAEDEAAFEKSKGTVMEISQELVPVTRMLL